MKKSRFLDSQIIETIERVGPMTRSITTQWYWRNTCGRVGNRPTGECARIWPSRIRTS